MANEFTTALLRDRAMRNRLEGKSGVLADYIANTLDSAAREAEQSEAARREQWIREDEREKDQQEELEREEREQTRLEAEAKAAHQSGQVYRDLLRRLPSLVSQTTRLAQAKDCKWPDVVDVGCQISCAEQVVDLFNLSDGNLTLQLAELRSSANSVAGRFGGRPTLDSYIDNGRKLLELVDAQGFTNFSIAAYARLCSYQVSRGERAHLIAGVYTSVTQQQYPQHIQQLVQGLAAIMEEMGKAKWLGIICQSADGTTTIPGWFIELIKLHAYEHDRDAEHYSSWIDKLLRGAASPQAATAFVREKVRADQQALAPVVQEVLDQAQIVAGLVSTPDRIKPALESRPYKVREFALTLEETPTGIAGLIDKLTGQTRRQNETRVRAFAAETTTRALALKAAFDSINPEAPDYDPEAAEAPAGEQPVLQTADLAPATIVRPRQPLSVRANLWKFCGVLFYVMILLAAIAWLTHSLVSAPAASVRAAPIQGTELSLSTATIADLEDMAARGNASAESETGVRYLDGRGVNKSYTDAAIHFGRAVRQNNDPRALTNIGWMRTLGQGTPRDDAQALNFFRAAANQDYPNAEDSLGYMYEHGRGVPVDLDIAATWYRKAADQGFIKAKANLMRLSQQ